MKETTSTAYFCPKCGSPSIEMPSGALVLEDAAVRCRVGTCGWLGKRSELLTAPVRHNQGSEDELMEAWSKDLRSLYAQSMGPGLAVFLVRWGFVPPLSTNPTKPEHDAYVQVFARFVAAMGAASARALLETKQELASAQARAAAGAAGGRHDA